MLGSPWGVCPFLLSGGNPRSPVTRPEVGGFSRVCVGASISGVSFCLSCRLSRSPSEAQGSQTYRDGGPVLPSASCVSTAPVFLPLFPALS